MSAGDWVIAPDASGMTWRPKERTDPLAEGRQRTSDVLFPDLVPVPLPEPPEKLSADRRRTQRQREDVERGRHPLTHGRQSTDPDARCGNCRFRELIDHHRRTYAKCVWIPTSTDARELESGRFRPPRFSNSAASDVRAWWPGCVDHEWGDGKLSPDAARCRP